MVMNDGTGREALWQGVEPQIDTLISRAKSQPGAAECGDVCGHAWMCLGTRLSKLQRCSTRPTLKSRTPPSAGTCQVSSWGFSGKEEMGDGVSRESRQPQLPSVGNRQG